MRPRGGRPKIEGEPAGFTYSEAMDSLPAATLRICFACYAPARYKCGRCGVAWYCGAPCQRADWPKHKGWCGKPVGVRSLTGGELLAEFLPAAGASHYITKGAVRGLLEDYRRLDSKHGAADLAEFDAAPFELGAAEWHDHWVQTVEPARLKKLSEMCREWLEADGERLPDL